MGTEDQEKIWYAVIDNKADGPHTASAIQEMLKSGKLNFTDFVFKPGLAAWTPISEFKEFERRNDESQITKITEHEIPKDDSTGGWIILTKNQNSVGQKNVVQSGPFSLDQVREKLIKNEISYDDFIWQKGFKQWTKIGSLEVFDRRRPEGYEKQPKPVFANDRTQDKTTVMTKEVTLGNDVAATGATISMTTDEPLKAHAKQTVPLAKPTNELDVAETPKRKSSSFLIAAGGGVVAMAFAYLGLNAYKENLASKSSAHHAAPEYPHQNVQMPPVPAPQGPVAPGVANSTGASANPPAVGMPQAATQMQPHQAAAGIVNGVSNQQGRRMELKIVSIKTNTPNKPQVLFETNLPAGTSIAVDVKGEPGQILNYPQLSLKKEVRVVAGQMPIIDLSPDDLPAGDYHVTAAGGGLNAAMDLKVGVHDKVLAQKLAAHKAQLVAQEKREKAGLMAGMQWLGKENMAVQKLMKDKNKKVVAKNLTGWKKTYSKKMKQYLFAEKQNPKMLVYPQAYSKLSSAAKTLAASRVALPGARVPASVGDDFKKKFSELQTEVRSLNFNLKK